MDLRNATGKLNRKPGTVLPGALFTTSVAGEDGPGARASVISLSLHLAAVMAAVFVVHYMPPAAPVLTRVTMLSETHLFVPPKPDLIPAGGRKAAASGGDHQIQQAVRGPSPRPTEVRAPSSLTVSNLHPVVPMTAVLLDVDAPKIEAATHYGNPFSHSDLLSPGPGFGGVGNGSGNAGAAPDGSGSGGQGGSGGTVYRMAELSQGPVLLYKVEPDYSDEARAARCHGTVLLTVVIDEKGTPRSIRVVRPLGLGLDEKAVQAVQHWRFRPGFKDGKAVCVAANVEVNFQLL